MRALLAIGVVLLSATSSLASAIADQPERPRRVGAFSTVTLLDVSRPPSGFHLKTAAGADDSLVFFFLISRGPGASGLFTLREPRDFLIDGHSYSSATRALLRREFEPNTIIEDVSDFARKVRPDLAQAVSSARPEADRTVLYTLISGAALQPSSRGQITIEVGWGARSEPFTFAFDVPSHRAE
jgi:hypothetical protein